MIVKLVRNPARAKDTDASLEWLGYDWVEVLAIFPVAIKKESTLGDWATAQLHVHALCNTPSDKLSELAWDDIQDDIKNGWLVPA